MGIKPVFTKTLGKEQFLLTMLLPNSGRKIRIRFDTEREAKEARDAIKTDAIRETLNLPLVRAKRTTIKEYAASVIVGLEASSNHKSLTEKAFRKLVALLGKDFLVRDLTEVHFERYIAMRLKEGVKRSTITSELATLKARLKTKTARTLFPDLKGWFRPDFPPVHAATGRTRVITREEEKKILAELRKKDQGQASKKRTQVADVFFLALRTGMRRGEILNLRWSDVHLEKSPGYLHGWLDVRGTKTKGSVRVVPLSPQAHKMLTARRKVAKGTVVFPSTHESNANLPQRFVHDTLREACTRSGIAYGRSNPDGLVFHDTRHTAITRMILAGYDLKTIGAIVGHTDAQMTMKYSHASTASKQSAVNALDDDGKTGVRLESKKSGSAGKLGKLGNQ